jgi:diguanylate cyclase (GGDEF)-like protein
VAERIRASVENQRITCEKAPNAAAAMVTISIGVETLIPDQQSSLDLFISAADTALYEAKAAGRNRVRVAGAGGS